MLNGTKNTCACYTYGIFSYFDAMQSSVRSSELIDHEKCLESITRAESNRSRALSNPRVLASVPSPRRSRTYSCLARARTCRSRWERRWSSARAGRAEWWWPCQSCPRRSRGPGTCSSSRSTRSHSCSATDSPRRRQKLHRIGNLYMHAIVSPY